MSSHGRGWLGTARCGCALQRSLVILAREGGQGAALVGSDAVSVTRRSGRYRGAGEPAGVAGCRRIMVEIAP